MEENFFPSGYLSSRFNGLCEKAFLIVWLPLFIEWVTLLGATGWFPLAATMGDDDEGRMPFVRALKWLFGMVENWFKRSWGRSSWSKAIDRKDTQGKKKNIRFLPGMRGGPIFNVIVRPESLIRLTTSVCGIWVRSTLFTAKIRSLTCSWPHWSAGLFGMILPRSKCTAITISFRGIDVEQRQWSFSSTPQRSQRKKSNVSKICPCRSRFNLHAFMHSWPIQTLCRRSLSICVRSCSSVQNRLSVSERERSLSMDDQTYPQWHQPCSVRRWWQNRSFDYHWSSAMSRSERPCWSAMNRNEVHSMDRNRLRWDGIDLRRRCVGDPFPDEQFLTW